MPATHLLKHLGQNLDCRALTDGESIETVWARLFLSGDFVEKGWVAARRFNGHLQECQYGEENRCRDMVKYVSLAVSFWY